MFDFIGPDEEFSLGNIMIGEGRSINYAINWRTGASMMFTEGANMSVIAFEKTQAFENRYIT